MNTMSRNIEKGSLNGEAEHRSRILGYFTNRRATLSVERKSKFFSSCFLRCKERGECRFRKGQVTGPLWRESPRSRAEYRHGAWRVRGFTVFLCAVLHYSSPGCWLFGSIVAIFISPSGLLVSIIGTEKVFMLQCSALWRLSLGSTCSLSLSQFCIWKRLFPPFSGMLWKIKAVSCPDPTVLQKWCICIHASWMGGGVCAISDIFWSTWHIVLRSPEDWGCGQILLYSGSSSNWLYQKQNNAAVLQLGTFGSKAESLTSHLNSHAHSHSDRSFLVLTFLLFLPPKFSYCITEWRVCGCLDGRCLILALTSASEKSHSVTSVPSLSPLPRRFGEDVCQTDCCEVFTSLEIQLLGDCRAEICTYVCVNAHLGGSEVRITERESVVYRGKAKTRSLTAA